jgi:hypothetical protein
MTGEEVKANPHAQERAAITHNISLATSAQPLANDKIHMVRVLIRITEVCQ